MTILDNTASTSRSVANAESTTSSPVVGTTEKENTSKEINSKESLTPTLTPNGSDQGSRNRYNLIDGPSGSCNFCEINKGS